MQMSGTSISVSSEESTHWLLLARQLQNLQCAIPSTQCVTTRQCSLKGVSSPFTDVWYKEVVIIVCTNLPKYITPD